MTSAFDDDEFQGNFVNVNNYDDEDDDVMDNWEDVLDEEEEAEKKRKEAEAEENRKRLEKEKRLAKREEERLKNEQMAALMSAKPLSKAEQEQAQLESAAQAASDLFGTDDLVIRTTKKTSALTLDTLADSIDAYVPVESEDFAELSRRIVKKLKKYEGDDGYHQFVRDLVPELCREMTSDEIKKISNPLQNFSHEKARIEKDAKKKAAPTKKSSLAANKKTINSSNLLDDYAAAEYDDYDDGIDFM